jgi:hypothetical protein
MAVCEILEIADRRDGLILAWQGRQAPDVHIEF